MSERFNPYTKSDLPMPVQQDHECDPILHWRLPAKTPYPGFIVVKVCKRCNLRRHFWKPTEHAVFLDELSPNSPMIPEEPK